MLSDMKPCPYCGCTKTDISKTVASRKRYTSLYHFTVYCTKCRSTGPRVLAKFESATYNDVQNDTLYTKQAIDAWNNRL